MTTRPKILLLGDSLTQTSFEGWSGKLADVFQRRADVVNRGYSGYNTEFYLHLDTVWNELLVNVQLAVVWFGANDAGLPDLAAHHHVPLERYRENLNTILNRLQVQFKPPRIILITPPPVHHEQRLAHQVQRYGEKATGELERTLEQTRKYALACQRVASEKKLPCLNLFDLMHSEADFGRYFHDGLHFSKQGHEFVANALLRAIQEHFASFAVIPDPYTSQWCNSGSHCDSLSSQGPYHDQIDHSDIGKAFPL